MTALLFAASEVDTTLRNITHQTVDISTNEQFSLCVLYVDEKEVTFCEGFLKCLAVSNASGQVLTNRLFEV